MDWSNLKEEYDRLGSLEAVAKLHECSIHKVWNEMRRQAIPSRPAGGRKGRRQTPEERAIHRAASQRPEVRAKHRANLLARLPTMGGSSANSPLEKLLHRALQRAGISFTTQQIKLGRYVVDIELLKAPIIIEADGARHHLNHHRAADALRDANLVLAGYRVFRFSGTEINRDSDLCIQMVMAQTGLEPDAEPVALIRAQPAINNKYAKFTCSQCGSIFGKPPSSRSFRKTFCNKKCYGDWLREHHAANPVLVRWQRHRANQIVT